MVPVLAPSGLGIRNTEIDGVVMRVKETLESALRQDHSWPSQFIGSIWHWRSIASHSKCEACSFLQQFGQAHFRSSPARRSSTVGEKTSHKVPFIKSSELGKLH